MGHIIFCKNIYVSTCKNIVEVRQPAGYPASAAGLPGAGGERGAAEEPLHPPLPLPLAHRQDTVSCKLQNGTKMAIKRHNCKSSQRTSKSEESGG